jgi:hypothetical protein
LRTPPANASTRSSTTAASTIEHPAFQAQLPTTENLAVYLWRDLREGLNAPIEEVSVHESETLASAYAGEQATDSEGVSRPVVTMTRLYIFSAAHRLYNPNSATRKTARFTASAPTPTGTGTTIGSKSRSGASPIPSRAW